MKAAKTKKPAAPEAPRPQPVVVFRFDDGDMRMPLAEHEMVLIQQAGAMATSDDPDLRAAGRARQREDAARRVRSYEARIQSAANARNERPSARVPLRAAIIRVMRIPSLEGIPFMTFLERWEREARNGLQLIPLNGGEYRIDDRNARIAKPVTRTLGTLRGMYSEAKNSD